MICKYSARVYDVETGEVREIRLTCNIMKFWQELMRIIRMFLSASCAGDTLRLRVDISKS